MRGLLHFKPPFKKEATAIEHKARVMRHKERRVFIKDINLDTGPPPSQSREASLWRRLSFLHLIREGS
ncbi:hypothetical protein KUCAC02_035513 [Chaenocephalus aceratus]|nr:hypothetical protein KUCAC02_035513 [Chaenocephalus aceratus]